MGNFSRTLRRTDYKLCMVFLAVITGFSMLSCGVSNGGGISGNGNTPVNFPPPASSVEGMSVGWNLGNSLDAVRSWDTKVAEETAWGNPVVTQALLNGVRAQGFDIVRIPVTWNGHIGSAPDYKVSSTRLKRVAEVVGYARNAGLNVIINMHHDDSFDFGWLKIGDAVADSSKKAQITDKYGKVWTQIAEYFKDYGDFLIFESMNEVQDGGWGWSDDFRANPKAQIDIINEWNQLFTDNVRATGGNNANRYLMYPSYSSNFEAILPDGNYKDGAGEVGKYFKLPDDSASGRQIVTFHYYEPFGFAHPVDGKVTTEYWGTQTQKDEVDKLFARFKKAFVDKNIPVVIGEMGPVNLQTTDTGKANRLAYISYVYGKAKENGLIPVYWDDGGDFGMMSRSANQPKNEHSAASFQAMVKAAGK